MNTALLLRSNRQERDEPRACGAQKYPSLRLCARKETSALASAILAVVPAKAGIHKHGLWNMGPGFRRGDTPKKPN